MKRTRDYYIANTIERILNTEPNFNLRRLVIEKIASVLAEDRFAPVLHDNLIKLCNDLEEAQSIQED